MADWKDNDDLPMQAEKTFFSHPIDNLDLDPFHLESNGQISNCDIDQTDSFSISTLKVELGELQEVQDDKSETKEDIAARFSYIIGAPQSLSTKESQNNLTYFNKGQTYEMTFKCNTPNLYCGYMIESNVLLRLQEKKLQAKEREMFDQWNSENNCRLLEAVSSTCVNTESVTNDTLNPNSVHVVWNPAKVGSLFIKVHCLSGDFTKRKHSGEKGVPFLLSVDTYIHKTEKPSRYLGTSACVLKIFQNKGAERKHRNETKQVSKLTEEEKGQLANPSDVTHLKPITRTFDVSSCSYSEAYNTSAYYADNSKLSDNYSDPDNELNSPKKPCIGESRDSWTLTSRSSVHDTLRWLRNNRFNGHIKTFNNFSGFDLLRLSRNDLTDLIGATDGIRLHNALQNKAVTSKLCLYVMLEGTPNAVHQAVYLESLTYRELVGNICGAFSLDPNSVGAVQKSGPNGINICVTDEVVRHLENDTCFKCSLLPTDRAELFIMDLR
ncbi:upstream-binding protein 1-like [Bolinopsis microptera]|uniref:upstream-binding protein 1-like n=1 Tax=Bolinopsis microptera TaxID=2820187 RepID=UPI003078C6A7